MLELKLDGAELFNEQTLEFVNFEPTTIRLEYSLEAISRWESKWHKPFLQTKEMLKNNTITNEMMLDYISCMSIDGPISPETINRLTESDLKKIKDYMEDPMTATWFSKEGKSSNKDVITAELIYYMMVSYNIPFECEKWHLNRLLTLIRVCGEKNKPPKKMKKSEILANNHALNKARRKASGSKG